MEYLSLLLLFLFTLDLSAYTSNRGKFGVGVNFGNTMIKEDNLSKNNVLLTGYELSYYASNYLVMKLGGSSSDNSEIKMERYDLGVDFKSSTSNMSPYFGLGVTLMTNELKGAYFGQNDTAMGVYGSGGIDFSIEKKVLVSMEVQLTKAMSNTVDLGGGDEITPVMDNASLMVKVKLLLGEGERR